MQGFTWIDTVVLAAYLAGIATLGSVRGRGQKDVGDYFLGGRTFHWLPIALSVIATDLSAITYMAAGVLDAPINHEEVLAMGLKVRDDFRRLLDSIINHLSEEVSEQI